VTARCARRCRVCRASPAADADASSSARASNPAHGRHNQERSSTPGLTGDVDGELPPAQNTAFWVVFVITPYKPSGMSVYQP
jgi:hypothetical protein